MIRRDKRLGAFAQEVNLPTSKIVAILNDSEDTFDVDNTPTTIITPKMQDYVWDFIKKNPVMMYIGLPPYKTPEERITARIEFYKLTEGGILLWCITDEFKSVEAMINFGHDHKQENEGFNIFVHQNKKKSWRKELSSSQSTQSFV